MRINKIKTQQILELEKVIGRELIVNERSDPKLKKYYVSFLNGEISEGILLIGYCGDGNTINQALKDYCKKISNKTIVFNAYCSNRVEFNLPKLIHTKK